MELLQTKIMAAHFIPNLLITARCAFPPHWLPAGGDWAGEAASLIEFAESRALFGF